MSTYTRKIVLFLLLLAAPIAAFGVTASFTADYISGCAPLVVHFTNTSTGGTSFDWDLGNGTTTTTTSTGTGVSGSYLTAGTYTVTLTAHNGSSTSVYHITITVYPSPVVSFTATDTGLCPGSSATFTSTSTAGTTGACTYVWNFGDGSSSTATSPTHTFVTPGFYNVTLVVTNSMGCSSSLTVAGFIHVYNHSVPAFTASSTYLCNPPASTTFTSTTSGASPFTYVWTFGDGSTSAAATPTHTYTASGTYSVKLVVTDVHGCSDSIVRTAYITVASMTTSFTGPSTACANSVVTFSNTSSAHSASYWTFGDGGTSSSDPATHTYSTAGTYRVMLVTFSGPCTDTAYQTITILPSPTISFTISPTMACPAPSAITFTGSVPSGSTVSWDFGDGTSGSGASTTHTYSADGTYNITMTVSDASGCMASVTQIYVIRDLLLTLVPDVFHGCVPLTVHFLDSINTLTPYPGRYPAATASWHWDFGDGSTAATDSTPAHTYTASGSYMVVLDITTTNGCTARMSVGIEVGDTSSVYFTDTQSVICYGHPITFFPHLLSGGPIDYYMWDWGDGSASSDSSSHILHSFTRPGFDTVTVTGYSNGCPGRPYKIYPITIDSPMASIFYNFDCHPANKVTFYDSSYGDDTHFWSFGDGTTSTADSFVITYPGYTTYYCSLATYNARSGCRDTQTIPIHLIPPVLHLYASDSLICQYDHITFQGTITGGAYATEWAFCFDGSCIGTTPGASDTTAMVVDTFRRTGLYNVMMVVKDWHGCLDTLIHNNWILVAKPVTSFVATPPRGCVPLTVSFTDHSTDDSSVTCTNFTWLFGDGATTSGTSVSTSHTYTAAGTYSITEIVTDNVGCKDTLVRSALIVASKPHASFGASSLFPCRGQTIRFGNASTGGGLTYHWLFGDGSTSTLVTPTHAYTNTGTFTVKLAATDSNGCTDSAIYVAYIVVSAPDASFTMSDSFSICPPLTVNFTNTTTGGSSYYWSFGDGSSSYITSPIDLYASPGLYHIMLVATNSSGCTDTAYRDLNVFGYAGGFTYSPLQGCAPLTVNFHAAIINVPSVIWDFADGNTTVASMVDSTTHTYTQPGAYLPKLILSDNTGCRNSTLGTDTIKVDAVRPGFTTIPHPVCVNTDIHFQDTSFSYFSNITSWHWAFQSGDTSNMSSPPYLYTSTGTFYVTLNVKDGWGCFASTRDTVTVYPPPATTTSPDTVICVGDTATLRAYGGESYVWSPAATIGCPACESTSAYPVVVTTYTVTGTDINGCVNIDSVTIRMRTLTVSRGWGDTEVCDKVPVQLFDTGGTKYTWIPSTGLNNSHVFNPVATPSVTTNYMVIVQYGGCIPDTNYVNLIIDPLPTVDAGPDQSLVAGSEAHISAHGTNISTYLWTPGQYLSCDSCYNPSASLLNTTSFTVTVTSIHGCTATDSITIHMFCDKSQIFIPNSFTPNGDGENDVFYPRGTGVSNIKSFRIYNRWGEVIFEKQNISINDAASAWDGSFNGVQARPGVYVYFVDAVCDTGEPLFIKGDVTIIR